MAADDEHPRRDRRSFLRAAAGSVGLGALAVLGLANTTEASATSIDCESKCANRCHATQYKKPCMFFCRTCCKKCQCVPPGYYGNKGVCPCYRDLKTKKGTPKCP